MGPATGGSLLRVSSHNKGPHFGSRGACAGPIEILVHRTSQISLPTFWSLLQNKGTNSFGTLSSGAANRPCELDLECVTVSGLEVWELWVLECKLKGWRVW